MSVLHTLFPKVRAEVIRLLFSDSSRELHLRDLARSSGLAVRTLQTELSKLQNADLLTSRRDGNRLYFKANTTHPVFLELQGLALKTTGLTDRLRTALEGLAGIEIAFVFGSIASGNENAGSDVDLFVIGSVGLRKLSPRLRPLSEEMSREINPYVLSSESFTQKAKAEDTFIRKVLESPKFWIHGSADELAAMAT